MLIKSITLENFRQFKGKQVIKFSTDSDKNVTVLKGENGSGKTTILEAFRWCFYSEFNLPNPWKMLNTDITNKMNPLDVKDVSVEINFYHNKTEYFIKRCETFIKKNGGDVERLSRDSSFKKKDKNGNLVTEDDYEVNTIIPKDLSTYFFFDGERIENLAKPGNKGKKDLSHAVRSVLGLDILLNAKKHLTKLSEEFEKDYNDGNSQEVDRIRNELIETRKEVEKYNQIIITNEEEVQILNEKIKEREEKIKANSAESQLQSNRENLENEKVNTEKNVESLLKDIEKNNKYNLPEFLANKLLNLSSGKIDLSSIKAKGIIGMDGAAIEYIINRGECICGQKIVKGSEAYNKLIIQKDYQPPASLGTIMVQFNERTENVRNSADDFYKTFKEKYMKVNGNKERAEKISDHINKITEQLMGSENVKELENERLEYLKEKRELEDKLVEYRIKLENATNSIVELEKELDKLALTNDRNKIIKLRKSYSMELERLLADYYNDKENKVRNELSKRVSEIFDNLIDTNHRIEINEDYTFRVIDIDGEDATSQGQDVITSFAFIGGLIDIARKEHNDLDDTEPYPLIMDAPFAKLSKTHRRNVARILPKIAEQFILFTVDSQYEGDIEETLKPKIGRQYELKMHFEDEKYTEIR